MIPCEVYILPVRKTPGRFTVSVVRLARAQSVGGGLGLSSGNCDDPKDFDSAQEAFDYAAGFEPRNVRDMERFAAKYGIQPESERAVRS